MLHRIGCFFLILGAALLGLYLLSDHALQPQWNYLLGGIALFLVGLFLWRRHRPPARRSSRFRVLRRRGEDLDPTERDD